MSASTDKENLINLFSQHNFVMTTAELTVSKLYYADIQKMLNEGLIEKVKRGYYHWIDKENSSEVIIINRLFPDVVLCMDTALFYADVIIGIKPAKKIEDSVEEILAYMAFPFEHWTRIHTNNVIERVNREIRCRNHVVGACPDGNSALMLQKAVLFCLITLLRTFLLPL